MAAEDLRTNVNFRRLPQTIRDARGQFTYIKVPLALFDTATGVKTICNLPKGTRVLDAKMTATTVAGASYIVDLEVNDGTTTTTVISGLQTSATNTARVATAVQGEALLNGTANTLRLNATTASTTNGAITILLTLARENT